MKSKYGTLERFNHKIIIFQKNWYQSYLFLKGVRRKSFYAKCDRTLISRTAHPFRINMIDTNFFEK